MKTISHTVTGKNTMLFLSENASYEGVKKNGDPAGWYAISEKSCELCKNKGFIYVDNLARTCDCRKDEKDAS